MTATSSAGRRRSLLRRLHALLPEGRPLPRAVFERRHAGLVRLLVGQVAALLALAVLLGRPWASALGLVAPLGLAGAVAMAPDVPRRLRTAATSLGLLGCSAVLVHLLEGATESHFHVFVMLAVITLYREWLPLLLGVGFFVTNHVVTLALAPEDFVTHPTGPVTWGVIHGLYVVATGAAGLLAWRIEEHERSRSQRVLDATAEGIYGTDPSGGITFANASLARLLGVDEEWLVGRSPHAVAGHGDSGGRDLPADDCAVCRAIDIADGMAFSDATFRRADGTAFPVELTAAPAVERGVRTGTVVSVRDLTEQVELTDRALRDPLTGLPNRALFMDRLAKALARVQRSGDMLAMMFIDLDRFKVVNDSLGHAAGDALLLAAADRLRASVRAPDTVARFGGDEFVVLCEGLHDERDVFIVAERIVTAFSRPFSLDGSEVSASASVGITVTRDGTVDPDTLVRDADAAMYRAKEGGRGRFELFDRGMRSRALRRLQTESDLWRAIARDELTVHYQPQVDLRDGRIIGVEALVRWVHPERGMIGPAEFIPVAEETGLIGPIGTWVLEEACAQLQRWRAAIPAAERIQLSVNLSARQLTHATLLDTVTEVLQRTGLPPALLCLEITESTLMDDVQQSQALMEGLKGLGVDLAVDDFGTGYSSLAYLSRFPVDTLKVDRAFVAELGTSAETWPIVAAITGLGRALGLRTVAEGVEDPTQVAALRGLGCEGAQGYLFQRPAAPEAIEALLRAGAVPLAPPADDGHAPVPAPARVGEAVGERVADAEVVVLRG
jgi:diguanylate cyclase (GGDEF)-like protein/PAS domain S-box-containing protein